jgi:putative protein kinase ArgK-like GTPase of G3E family
MKIIETIQIGDSEIDMKETLTLIFFVALLAALSVAGAFDRQEAERAADEYTEMVCLFKETSGEFGWPDFKNLKITCGE